MVHFGTCVGGNGDCKPNNTEGYNTEATKHDTGQGK